MLVLEPPPVFLVKQNRLELVDQPHESFAVVQSRFLQERERLRVLLASSRRSTLIAQACQDYVVVVPLSRKVRASAEGVAGTICAFSTEQPS